MSFTLFCPRKPLHSAPFAPSLVIHCVVILNTCIDSVVTPGNPFFANSKVYLNAFSFMAVKGRTSPHSRVILIPNEYKKYIHLTQVAKFAFISFVAQNGNASTCLPHSSDPWILDFGVSDHFFGNKDIFLPLLLHHLYP